MMRLRPTDHLVYFLLRLLGAYRLYALAEAIADKVVWPYASPVLGVLLALIKVKREKYDEVYQLCVGLRAELNKLEPDADVIYLQAYLVTLGAMAEYYCVERDQRIFDQRQGNEPWEAFYARRFAKVDLHGVKRHLKETFKLTEHPRWHTANIT